MGARGQQSSQSCPESEEVLRCEGTCRQLMHRYCAGVTRQHYHQLSSSSEPFVCLFCTKQSLKAELRVLQL